MKTNTATLTAGLSAYGRDWNNLEPGTSDDEARLIEPLTLGELMLTIDCNLPQITPSAVRAQFRELFRMKTEEASSIFEANLDAILAAARKTRSAK
ncbi:MAG: hypothetical protein WC718_00450 [Phycisphaerales bacterium]|jgi:hypothetical protein